MTSNTPARSMTRVRHGAAVVPGVPAPWDRLQYRLFHPALFANTPEERQTGQLQPDREAAPWPVVILLNGINVGPEGYRWLAERLAAAGIATVTFTHVSNVTADQRGLSPGLDLDALDVAQFGSRPSATTVGPLLAALAAEQADGPLAGLLDLERVALGGHSAGGTIALLNADPAWFPGVRAAFSYAGHTMPAAVLGHPDGTVLPVPADTPALVLGGSHDGVVAASAVRYGRGDAPLGIDDHDPITETFRQGTSAAGSALGIIRGAGHLSFCDPVDPTTARGFLETDDDPGGPGRLDRPGGTGAGADRADRADGTGALDAAARRDLIGSLVIAFCTEHLCSGARGSSLSKLATAPGLARFELRSTADVREASHAG